jgi:hypothetical protein
MLCIPSQLSHTLRCNMVQCLHGVAAPLIQEVGGIPRRVTYTLLFSYLKLTCPSSVLTRGFLGFRSCNFLFSRSFTILQARSSTLLWWSAYSSTVILLALLQLNRLATLLTVWSFLILVAFL